MIKLYQTVEFRRWQQALTDPVVQKLVAQRMARLELGQQGDAKALGQGLFEMRIHTGPGYRIYFCWRGTDIVLLLCAGDKSNQARDIKRARKIADTVRGPMDG